MRTLHSLLCLLSAFCLSALFSRADDGAAAPAPTQSFSREQLVAGLADSLVRHFSLTGDLQVEVQRAWTEPAPAQEPWILNVVEFPAQLSSNALVRIRLESAGRKAIDATLPLRLQLWKDAYVTREPCVREDELDLSNLDLRRVDALQDRDNVFSGTIVGAYLYSRPVSAGKLLCWRDLSRRAMVRKGDVVEVQAIDGSLAISMKALAMQSGAPGEVVTVRNLESKRDIHARVVGEKRVVVTF